MSRAALLLLLFAVPSAPAAPLEQVTKRGDTLFRLTLEVRPPPAQPSADRLEVSFSGEVVATLTVESAAAVLVEAPAALTASVAWKQLERSPGWTTTPLPDDRVRRQMTFHLSPRQLGDVPLTLAPLRYRPGGDWQEVVWKPVPTLVTMLVPEVDARSARGITGIEELPHPESGAGGWIVLAVGLVVPLIGAGLWLFLRKQRGLAAAAEPHEWALRKLARLEAQAAALGAERYHTLLADVVRRYLELRFGLHAPRQTTAEFLQSTRQSPQLSAAQQELLREFLERADLAKFALAQPSLDEHHELTAKARSLVEQTRPASTAARAERVEP